MALPFDLVAEAKRLIRFDTVTWSSNAEIAVHVGNLMRRLGLEVSYQEARAGGTLFMNVLGLMGRATKAGGPVLWASHLDTVPAGDRRSWNRTGGDPWKLTRRGELLYGLGAADAKLDLLCKLAALGGVKPSQLKRPLLVLGTFGEESGLRGAARFCQGDLPKPEMALVGEPTELALVNRHKGLAVLELTFRSRGLYRPDKPQWAYEISFQGRACHSSTPELGENAIDQSLELLQGCRERFGKVMVLSWEGGEGHNMIPASCTIRLSLGDRPKEPWIMKARARVRAERVKAGWYPTLRWEEAVEAVGIFRAAVAPLQRARDGAFHPPTLTTSLTGFKQRKEGWALTMDLRPLPGQSVGPLMKNLEKRWWKRLGPPGPAWQWRLERDNPPLDLEAGSPLIRLARAALRQARIPVRVEAKAGCSEAGLYGRVGIPSLVVGPGRARGNIHRPNEAVPLKQLRQAVRFYRAFLERACL